MKDEVNKLKGINYFPLDVHSNDNVKLIEAEFGIVAFAVLIKLYQRIYAGHGYYYDWNDEIALLFANNNNIKCSLVKNIVTRCTDRGIFDKSLYEKYGILTSFGIQERFFKIIKRRKSISVNTRYLLINIGENADTNGKNANISDKHSSKTIQNEVNINQSKEKESKEKKSIKYKHGKYKNVLLTKEEYQKLKDIFPDWEKRIDDLDCYIGSTGRNYKSHYMTILSWSRWNKNIPVNNGKTKIQADEDYFKYNKEYLDEDTIEKIMNM